jgi:hypothetical protein
MMECHSFAEVALCAMVEDFADIVKISSQVTLTLNSQSLVTLT